MPYSFHQGWVALSDRGLLNPASPDTLLHQGLFVMELALPLQSASLLLDHQSNIGWPRTFAIFHDPATGIVILHRQGKDVARHVLPGPLPQGKGTARLSFHFNAPARHWSLCFELLTTDPPLKITAEGQNPLPIPLSDLQALCTQPRPTSPVLWFGLTEGKAPPGTAPWIGLRTPVETSLGPVLAGHLKPGDILLTEDHGPIPLLAAQRLALPARGSFAPVLLRAPFFGQTQDLLVSADQLLAISGPEVEYLFGADAALMPAGALVDGRTALSDQRRAITGSVALDLGTPALIESNGCLLAIGQDQAAELPLRCLQTYEVHTLMTLLGRSPRRAA
ncbi:Hint domain-containing protein [Cypionkella sp.]|uniref:Hint domain-containing protein n=1 Tax=Cypionkella sp. TaxID=2811411 RepID=UPI002AB88F35|nr:Hint domain-containing protein [Cypionkella sp.]MDZ4394833.1 Hint domain-containing protein [Cypionkella sp.]